VRSDAAERGDDSQGGSGGVFRSLMFLVSSLWAGEAEPPSGGAPGARAQ